LAEKKEKIMIKKEQKNYILKFRAIDKDIWQAIKIGKKRVETRAATVRYRNMKAGDIVIFSCQQQKFERQVKKVKIFKSIIALLKNYKVKDINPNFSTTQELVKMYSSFSRYKEKINKYGIIAIEFEKI